MDDRPEVTIEDLGFLHWWGMPTLFRCPHDPDPGNCDIALVGVPHSSGNGTTWRDQHLGPRALRDLSMNYRRLHLKWRFDPWSAVRIHDLGDVPIRNSLVNDIVQHELLDYFRTVDAAGARPVSIGGDHVWPSSCEIVIMLLWHTPDDSSSAQTMAITRPSSSCARRASSGLIGGSSQ